MDISIFKITLRPYYIVTGPCYPPKPNLSTAVKFEANAGVPVAQIIALLLLHKQHNYTRTISAHNAV